jgi:hypothetical protein
MRSRRWAYLAAAGLVAGMLALANSRGLAQPKAVRPPVAWEYRTLYWGAGDPTRSLNELGQEGWELVAVRGYGAENQSQTLYVFKRSKP